MFCENCLLKVYDFLSTTELAILYAIVTRLQQASPPAVGEDATDTEKKLASKLARISSEIEPPTFEKIYSFFGTSKSQAAIRSALTFLGRLELLERHKKDHSWVYAPTQNGADIVALLRQDSAQEQAVIIILSNARRKK